MQRNADTTKPTIARVDALSLLSLGIVAIGWFGMNTIVVSFGRLVQPTRFYELGVIIAHPTALFLGVGGDHTLELTLFSLLAGFTLFAAVATPMVRSERWAWLAGWAPLLLMLLSAALLYANGSSTPPPAAANPGVRDDLLRLANHLMQQAQDAVVSHISVGAGGALSALASLALAVRSTRRFRAARARTGTAPAALSAC